MTQLLEAFSLGLLAIGTNACLLPLYPGLLAFLAGSSGDARAQRAAPILGAVVLAGVLVMMLLIGLLLFWVNQSFGAVLPVLLPVVYLLVIGMGVALLAGANPFARLSVGSIPVLKHPVGAAFAYGLLLAPMTLPCTGPIITSAFVLGANSSTALVDGLAYFLAFGLGFGAPLVVLPLLALPVQRRAVGWLTRHREVLDRASGVLLIAVGVFGVLTELLPVWVAGFSVSQAAWIVYWLVVVGVIAAVCLPLLRRETRSA